MTPGAGHETVYKRHKTRQPVDLITPEKKAGTGGTSRTCAASRPTCKWDSDDDAAASGERVPVTSRS